MATKNGGGGGLSVSASDTSFAYGLHYPVIYRSLFGCVDWPSISSCFDLPTSRPCKILHAHLSSLFPSYSATVEWFIQLFVWAMWELRFMILSGDIPMGLVSFGSTFVTSSSIYIALARASAICSSLTGFIPDVGVSVYLSSWWQSSFLIFLPIWSELDEQVSLVLQGSSSHRMLFSAYGAVCVVLRVTLDVVFKEAYDVVVVRFHMAPSCDLYRHYIPYVVVVVVCLVSIAFLYTPLLECKHI
ncbi:hypothetical protein F2Q70_00001196 [Brassica cretica]|uniref:Uncharacterized protein n=1 Tax=Brassica cretica TaxID=69181 RepID=A0A8S9IXS5_BRACR|nr:hypothetical protein F2Q70_00001196 [Brassica cretica]